MAKQRVRKNKNKGFGSGRYARTEQELHEKAVMLLDKCKIESRSQGETCTIIRQP